MNDNLIQVIDNLLEEIFLKENPDTVRGPDGRTLYTYTEGPAIAFFCIVDGEGRHKWFINDQSQTGRAAYHADIRKTSTAEFPDPFGGDDRFLRGRMWTTPRVCSFYREKEEIYEHSDKVEELFKILKLDIDDYTFEFGNSARDKGLVPWAPSGTTKPVLSKDEQEKVDAIIKQIESLQATLHLKTGDERKQVEREIDKLEKSIGKIGDREASKAAYRQADADKKSPYEKGGGAGMASYYGRLPAIAEEKVRIYNKTLCPDVWNKNELDPDVRETLLKIALDFFSGIELKTDAKDVHLLGSVANFNWTPSSDIDVHILIDGKELGLDSDLAEKLFRSLSAKWNLEHDIKVKGHKVEIYLQNIDEKNHATGVFSLVHNQWLKVPTPEDVNIDKPLIQKKYSMWVSRINAAIKKVDYQSLHKLLQDLKEYRQSGLDAGGEFSTENLVFKILRARGQIGKIKDHYNTYYDKEHTVKDGFDPTSVGPNPEASEGQTNAGFYQAQINKMRTMEETGGGNGGGRGGGGGLVLRDYGDTSGINRQSAKYLAPDVRAITIGDRIFGIPIKAMGRTIGEKWQLNRWGGAYEMKFPEWSKLYDSPEELVKDLNRELQKMSTTNEGYGAGVPEEDRLHIPDHRWQIKSKDAPKTPKLGEDMKEVIDEILDRILPLNEAPEQKTLKKNRVSLTDVERTEVMKRGAVWHHGPKGEETPAVWKSVVKGKSWYCCNTHRAIQIKPTLKGAIKAFDFIKTTA